MEWIGDPGILAGKSGQTDTRQGTAGKHVRMNAILKSSP
jgi:hypothetical protein